jgi:hypothetical protein
MDRGMDKDNRYGLMEPNMKVNGETTKLMAKESSGMPMEMFMKAIGRMIKPMVMGCTFILMELDMKETG